MKRRYRRLEVGESLRVGDFFTSKSNPQPPESMAGMIEVTDEQSYMFGKVYSEDILCNYYRPVETFRPQRLIRKYRLVKPSEPVRMFDWCVYSDEDYVNKYGFPTIDTTYNGGWSQILPDDEFWHTHLDPTWNREGWIYVRFVDCIPLKKS